MLKTLNRVVEQNVDPSMFITMFYGSYNKETHEFKYASAGHEPGFFYCNKENQFYDLDARGLVLGIAPDFDYKQYEKHLDVGDMVILFSDGVTESKSEDGFLEREDIKALISENLSYSAQEMVDAIYDSLLKLQEFQLHDDFTLLVLKRKV